MAEDQIFEDELWYLQDDTLEEGFVVNLAMGLDPNAQIARGSEQYALHRLLKRAMRNGALVTADRDLSRVFVGTVIGLADLWRFVRDDERAILRRVRRLCERWAEICDVDLAEIESLALERLCRLNSR